MRAVTRSRLDNFREVADILSPASLHQFLAVQAWTLHSQASFMETWVHADEASRPVNIVHLPRERDSVDFERRLVEAAQEVAQAFDWSLSQLAEQVASVHADIFYVRVRSSASDGTIPLHQASATIDAIEKMVKSAAIITNNPNARGTGRTSERVSSFLSDDLRMGHTRRGSFIITVAARLQARSQDLVDPAATPERTELSIEATVPVDDLPTRELDFTRRVMTTLSRSLDVTSKYLRHDDDFVDLDTAEDAGMTVPIVAAIEEIARQGTSSALDLKFEWSPVLEQQPEVAREITFEPPQVEKIPATIERMKRTTEPSDVLDVVGPVVSLSREQGGSADAGEVHVLADVDGYTRKIGIDLTGVAYDWAIYAHRHHLPFSVSGVLDKVSNRWRIVDRLTVNTEFLQRYQADRIERLTGERPEPGDGPVLE